MKKSLTTLILGVLSLGALTGCGSSEETKYIDVTADSIYGKISDFSSETVKAGDTLTFKVTPAKYFYIDQITNNGTRCKRVSVNEDGSAIYSTTIVEGLNKIVGAYAVDPGVDFVDEFKLDIDDDVFEYVMSKGETKEGQGNKLDLDFRRAGIEQCRAPTKWENGKKVIRSSKEVFVNYVDGDTTHVETHNLQYTVKIRYLNIDTPESTSEIEEWGLTASYYSKYIYTGSDEYKNYIKNSTNFDGVQAGVSSLILISKDAAINSSSMTMSDLKIDSEEVGPYCATTDGNQRNLAYVWYATTENPKKSDFRCLNLEMVYQGFSFGNGSREDCSDYYYKMFDAASLSAKVNGRHIYSSDKDDNYYYYEEKGINELTLKDLYASAKKDADIGYLPESDYANRKTLYKVKGFVSRKVGTSFYIQDKKEYDNAKVISGEEKPYGIYVFTYTETPIDVGDEVSIVGAVSSYGGTFQMQGVVYHTIDPDPVRDSKIISRNNTIVPVKLTGAQFNKLKLPQILVQITDNVWFYNFQSEYKGAYEDIGEGGSEEVNKYNDAYPFYNTSNSPIFYGSYGPTDNAEKVNQDEIKNIRYTDSVIRFTVDQNILVKYAVDTCYSYRFFVGGEYWYNPAGAEYASADYAPEKKPEGCPESEAVKYQAVKKVFKRKAAKPTDTWEGIIVLSHGYESTGGNRKMSATICSGSAKDIRLVELD